jgi:hypothetical protein
MKAWWILVALVGVASASPRPPEPPFERECVGPMSWDKVQKCIDRWEKGAKIRELSPDVKTVTQDYRQYLFARLGDRWRLAYQLGDENYEVVQRSSLTVHDSPSVRIDLSHHVEIGHDGVFFERVTLVCSEAPGGCQAMVTACTVITRGRAVETFRGELAVTDAGVTVQGDRSQSGSICRGR